MDHHNRPPAGSGDSTHTPYTGPTVASIDVAGAQYVMQQTGSTTNVRHICPSVSSTTINDAFGAGQTAPPEGYTPPADLQAAVTAYKSWQASKSKKHG